MSSYAIRPLASSQLPYYSTAVVPLVDTKPHDAEGVRMFLQNGVLYDHPVAQAQYAFQLINSYNVTHDVRYLDRARAQADRLIARAVTVDSAIYFLYPFSWYRGPNDYMQPPWFSGMAQGLGLSAFVRLYEITKDTTYRDAAVRTFNSLARLRTSSGPWVTIRMSQGYLWFEEYPKDPPDLVYNGFNFAIFGVYDYYRMTGSASALKLLRGAMTTSAAVFPQYRYPGWISRYGLLYGNLSTSYHFTVVGQMLMLYRMTGSVTFARDADALLTDYPDPHDHGSVHFAAGKHVGYRFDASGRIIGSKVATLLRPSSATAASRVRIRNRSGAWLQISDGIWKGYAVLEVPGNVFIPGMLQRTTAYDPIRSVSFAAGSHVGYQFSVTGAVTARRSGYLSRPSSASTSKRAIINGTVYLLMSNGGWAGFWLPLGGGISY